MSFAARVAVVGGGIMGRGIAVAFRRAGHPVVVVEPDADAAGAAEVVLTAEGGEAPVEIRSQLGPDLAEAEVVVEAIPERIELKRELWRRLGALASNDAVLASNTSALDIDVLAAEVPGPGRVLGMHWFNPAELIPCVEVVRGRHTAEAVIAATLEILRGAGKEPVVVRNSPGFVANRLQFALVREALLCLEEGIASAEDIDAIVRGSFGVRLAALGPLANADLGGLDTYRLILDYLAGELGERFAPPALLDALVERGRLGTKTSAGIADYTPESARELASRRDLALRRVLAAVNERSIDE